MVATILSILYCGWQYYREKKLGAVEREPIDQIRLSVVLSLIFVLLSALLYFTSLELPGATRWDAVGSRLIPQICITGLGIFSFLSLIIGTIKWASHPGKFDAINWERVPGVPPFTAIFAVMALWIVGIIYIGFYPASFVFLYALMYMLTKKVSWALVILPPATLFTIWLIFSKFLLLQLPRGPF